MINMQRIENDLACISKLDMRSPYSVFNLGPGLSSEAALRHEAAESAMDGSRDPRAGTRRTVKVLRRFLREGCTQI